MRILIFLAALFLTTVASAQDSTLIYSASLFLAGASGPTPYWQHVNQNGAVPTDGVFASGRWSAYKIYHPNDPRILQWSAGAELITNYGQKNAGQLFFSDLYTSVKLGPLELLAGQKKNITGIVDSTLTSGSLSVSGNSRPFPRLQLSIPDFLPLPFTNYVVAVKASYSDGLLGSTKILYGSTSYIPNTYFHQKQLYFRFGDISSRIKFYAGINHQAIWGGEDKIWPIYKLKPSKAYWYTITGKTLDYKKIGNHFGTIDIAADLKGKKWSYLIYRQNIYENSSIFKIINLTDGLTGIRLKRIRVKPKTGSYFSLESILLEGISTQDQSNLFSHSNLILFENGNYFNHYIYASGWSYNGRTIGTPLIPGANITQNDGDNSPSQYSNNNRSWVIHSAATLNWLNCSILVKGTYSRNLGTYLRPYESIKNQLSLLLSIERKVPFLKNSTFISSIASDLGKLYPNSTSVMVGIRKSGYMN